MKKTIKVSLVVDVAPLSAAVLSLTTVRAMVLVAEAKYGKQVDAMVPGVRLDSIRVDSVE